MYYKPPIHGDPDQCAPDSWDLRSLRHPVVAYVDAIFGGISEVCNAQTAKLTVPFASPIRVSAHHPIGGGRASCSCSNADGLQPSGCLTLSAALPPFRAFAGTPAALSAAHSTAATQRLRSCGRTVRRLRDPWSTGRPLCPGSSC